MPSFILEKAKCSTFLGVHIAEDYWTINITFPAQKKTLVSQVPAETEKNKSPPFHPHHIVQGKHIEHPEQLSGLNCNISDTKTIQLAEIIIKIFL